MFNVVKDIRRCDVRNLAKKLHAKLQKEKENFDEHSDDWWRPGIDPCMNRRNGPVFRRILARMTDFVEMKAGESSKPQIEDYLYSKDSRYEVEHIWADKYDRHKDEFQDKVDFNHHRNRIGALLLLPKDRNASLSDKPYSDKLKHYYSQNLLAGSLHPDCYQNNPGFKQFISETGLPFEPVKEFTKSDIDKRGELYRLIAKRIWNPDKLLEDIS